MLTLKNSYADNTQFNTSFNQGIQTAQQFQDQPMSAMKNLKMDDIIKNYTTHPKETDYKNKVDTLKTDAIRQSQRDPIGKTINDSIKNHPKFDIKPNSPEIKAITKQADDTIANVTGQFPDCTQKTTCTTTYETKTCQETPAKHDSFCQKTRTIDFIPHTVVDHYPLTLHIDEPREYVGVTINSVDGTLKFIQPRYGANAYLVGRVPKEINCSSLGGTVTHPIDGLDGFSAPSCQNEKNIIVHITRHHNIRGIDIPIDVTSTHTVFDQKDSWRDECALYANNPLCVVQQETCLESNSTHVMQSISVTRDCWEKEVHYLCHAASSLNTLETCQSLRDQGCEQIGSVCDKKTDAGCALYHQTLRCPTKKCTDVGMVCLGTTYCLNGDCVKSQKSVDPDFQKSISALSALNDASKNLNNNNLIFSGKIQSCDNTMLGAVTCCHNDGWLVDDIALVKCTPDEKELGKSKEKGLTVYVGEYCKKNTLGVCTVHRKAYCVFPSKLARIIQEQGRGQQLNIPFGDGEHPNCQGISIGEFQKLDLSQIDFSDFYADIADKAHVEDAAVLNDRVKNKMQNWADRHITHE